MPVIIPLPAFSDNYVWAIRVGGRAAVVDPGDDDPVEVAQFPLQCGEHGETDGTSGGKTIGFGDGVTHPAGVQRLIGLERPVSGDIREIAVNEHRGIDAARFRGGGKFQF